MRELDEGLIDGALVEAAYANPTLQRALRLHEGHGSDRFQVGEADTPGEAIDLVVAHLT